MEPDTYYLSTLNFQLSTHNSQLTTHNSLLTMLRFDSLTVREWPDPRTTKPHILPIYATSSFEFEDTEQGMRIFSQQEKGHTYGRYGNPTVDAVAAKIAALETYGSDIQASAVMTNSGMAAVNVLTAGLLKSGDKMLSQPNVYGGTTELMQKVVSGWGVEIIYTDLANADQVEKYLKQDPAIKLIYLETPANPTLACLDIEMLAGIARKYQRWTAIDNTFATPYLQQPLKLGVDFVIHSTTKYLNGHGNSIAGIVIGKDPVLFNQKIWNTMKLTGANCSPFEAWLVHQGLKTLPLRMDKHCSNAMTVATALANHPEVAAVNYPGLTTHPQHAIARKQMRAFGGMMSFELKAGYDRALRAMNRLKFCLRAPTLGDVDTLVLHPASSSHLRVAPELRRQAGISDGLIRISVGIENPQDILDDLVQAIA
ncbi:MAG TPA: aminotransferase class I/II-fold pyridoxal phosphate-dependent enzyme, partial [Saprospiraceae bacterium]|nr:aminotransferase class I/II-fold pyridoxal phosphate-dependent enzyme [Saprospiraceae bacterium]